MDFDRHLLVDGYNVIHAWPWLKRVLQKEGIQPARQRLVETLAVLHDFGRERVSLVFDGRGETIEIERPRQETTFSCLFTPRGMTADDLIEQLVGAATHPAAITVVTADTQERLTIEALGARAMSPDELVSTIERVGGRQRRVLGRMRTEIDKAWKNRSNDGLK